MPGDEVSRWWWALAGRAGAAGDIADAGGAAVRRGRGAGAGGGPAAGQHEVGLSVAATLACRRQAGVGLHRSGRDKLPAQRRPAAPAAHRAGARAGRARLDRPALDPGPRVSTLIGRLSHLRYTPRGTAYLLHRMGRSWQVPRHRAAERNEDAIAQWRNLTWAKVRG